MQNDPQNKIRYNSEDGVVQFKLKEFIKSFIYHIMFFVLIGPLTCIIIALVDGSNYMQSMKFWNLKDPLFWF